MLVLLILTTSISSCTTSSQRVTIAATTQGKIAAGVHLPELIPDCREQEPHAAIVAGAEVRSILIRERAALDQANGRVTRCAAAYDTLKINLEKN